MEVAQLVGVVVEAVGGIDHLMEIVAVVAGGSSLLGALAHDRELLAADSTTLSNVSSRFICLSLLEWLNSRHSFADGLDRP